MLPVVRCCIDLPAERGGTKRRKGKRERQGGDLGKRERVATVASTSSDATLTPIRTSSYQIWNAAQKRGWE